MMFHSPIITVMTLWLNIFLLLTMAIFLSDFPITASNAIDCFSHIGKNGSGQPKPSVISYKGPSGDYLACTDLAYEKAISDSVDVRDCPVQMTKDGIPICLGSIDLLDSTNVAQSPYSNFGVTIPELKSTLGIFTFNLTWHQIQSLRHLYMVLASHN